MPEWREEAQERVAIVGGPDILHAISITSGQLAEDIRRYERLLTEAETEHDEWAHALYLVMVPICEARLGLDPCEAIKVAEHIVRQVERTMARLARTPHIDDFYISK